MMTRDCRRQEWFAGVCLLTVGLIALACGSDPAGPERVEDPESRVVSVNTADFTDDFEDIPEGPPSSAYTVIQPDAEVRSLPQLGGTTGHVLMLSSGAYSSYAVMELTDAGARADFMLRLDHVSTHLHPSRIYFRAVDLNNAYYLQVTPEHSLALIKVEGGTVSILAAAPGGAASWRRITIQAVGSSIRVGTSDGTVLNATDGTFGAGMLYLAGAGVPVGGDVPSVLFDNLEVTAPAAVVPASAISLPFSTGFEASELGLRNGGFQHPNLEVQAPGGAYYGAAQQLNGSTGGVLALTSTQFGENSVAEVVSADLGDFRLAVDHVMTHVHHARIYFRAADPDNGYYVHIATDYSLALYRTQGGVGTLLATAPGGASFSWRRITIQAVGSSIRVGTSDGTILNATDGTFNAGKILLAGQVGGGLGGGLGVTAVLFDNLEVTAPAAVVPASAISLPFSTGFEASELGLRNGGFQHPNLEVQAPGGAYYGAAQQLNGSTGGVLALTSTQLGENSVAEVVSADLGDFRLAVDHVMTHVHHARIYFRAADPDNGYYVQVLPGQLSVVRIQGGASTVLASAPLSGEVWRRITIQALGGTITVETTDGASLTTVDGVFADGSILLAGRGGGGLGGGLGVTSVLFDNLAVGPPLSADDEPPLISDTEIDPNPAAINVPLIVAALIDDRLTGNSSIQSAQIAIDGGGFTPMTATDGDYDEPYESVQAAIGSFPEAGVHEVCVRGTDSAGNMSEALCGLVAIYDPTAGFVTGGGTIMSPEGAFAPNPTATGRAAFGFVSKYQKGATLPSGSTQFTFTAADLVFHSTAYQWLVVAGARAQFKGEGRLNGEPGYDFILTSIDGDLNGGGGADRFRIKILDRLNGGVLYDNQRGESDTSNAATELDGGSIVIHTAK